MWSSFEMPDERGTALDVLGRAAARGIDVRLICWRPDASTENLKRNAFWGSVEHIQQLERRRSGIRIRWDQAHPGFCQHQKSWLIDAGGKNEIAFVGGINLNPNSMTSPGHTPGTYDECQNHDAYIELVGPSTVDVHHNFVQRWNEASERFSPDGRWGFGSETDLPFPARIPAECGNAFVQIQRTIHSGRYTNGEATPGGCAFDIVSGEQTIFDQYCAAIDAARHSIYIENQAITVLEIVAALQRAVRLGVEVVVLLPTNLDGLSGYTPQQAYFESWASLGAYENFTLAGIASLNDDGQHESVYVHDKLMLVDDQWATVGSCNLHRYSLFGNAELNAAFWCPSTVRALRCELFQEHLAHDTSPLDDRAALRYFRKIAWENRRRCNVGIHEWQGLAFALDPAGAGH
ncbi:cardiolipin synthase B [Abditibacteriota bacterium]|nr:cardiolipin synthase B [Abditibacteriota bacterium]